MVAKKTGKTAAKIELLESTLEQLKAENAALSSSLTMSRQALKELLERMAGRLGVKSRGRSDESLMHAVEERLRSSLDQLERSKRQ